MLVAVSIGLSRWKRLDLEGTIAWSAVRAAVQLLAVGFILVPVLAADAPLGLSFLWILLMVVIAGETIQRRAPTVPGLRKIGYGAIGISTLTSLLVVFGLGILPLEPVALVPIAGIIVGNTMPSTVLAARRTVAELETNAGQIEAMLALGFSASEARRTVIKSAARTALVPQIERTKVVGLVALPGAMTGLLLAGVPPVEAVSVQLAVMYLILGAVAVSVIVVVLAALGEGVHTGRAVPAVRVDQARWPGPSPEGRGVSTYVLIGGVWLGTWAWERVTPLLEAGGHDVMPHTLPGLADRQVELPGVALTLSRQAEDVMRAISRQGLRDVILVAHSHSGLLGGIVADYDPTLVGRLVYLDANVARPHESFADGWSLEGRKWLGDQIRESGEDRWPADVGMLADALSEDYLAWVLAHSTSHPAPALYEPVPLRPGAHQRVPTTYVVCTRSTPVLDPEIGELIDQLGPARDRHPSLANGQRSGCPCGPATDARLISRLDLAAGDREATGEGIGAGTAMTDMTPRARGPDTMPTPLRAVLVVVLLYLFLAGVRLLEGGINGLGSDFTDTLFEGVSNPVAGLCVGVLATVLVQSSSVTTATIVGLVASGVLDVESAVPMIMGTNIGTTVTATLVALAHLRESNEFRLAFTAATMHDLFNVIVVAILLPVEVKTKALSSAARNISQLVAGGSGVEFDSPIKGAVAFLAERFEVLIEVFVSSETAVAVALLIVGVGLIFLTLAFITKNMRVLVAERIERSLNAALSRSGLVGMLVGVIVTIAVQSSSITTSILIPLVAAGVLLVRNAYPITLGANVGTTVTALLAALGAGSVDGLTIALVHTLFNVGGILLLYPWKATRYVPVRLAEGLAGIAMRRRSLAVAYVATVFIALPLLGTIVLR